MADQSPITPPSDESSNHHFEDQQIMLNKNLNDVVDKIETEIVETAQEKDHKQQVDDDEVLVDINAILLDNKMPPLLSESCCIYKVPHRIRQGNEEAYTPKLVSIGPLHCYNPRLQNMERHKQLLFKKFVDRSKSNTRLEDLINYVKSAIPKVRACYLENIELRERELVQLILVDASFIIVLFLMRHENDKLFKAGSIMSIPLFLFTIVYDLLLLENQLPFFVLEGLFKLAFPPHICKDLKLPSFLELTFKFFSEYNEMQNIEPNPRIRIKHFTDLLRIFYLPTDEPKTSTSIFKQYGSKDLSYSASELHEAGVKLKELKGSKGILELKFSGRDLEIPQISVDDATETLFRNMIALEQCHYYSESYITDLLLYWIASSTRAKMWMSWFVNK
ncbi:UPF0481 protein [Senna tora]|uniref:UPF0481 protein n=1 Tax=Senna tora TaxID=362788 RepID=A0A834U2N7_9FABA|nr:UPF0481 protein [Senna tora]